MDCHNEEGVARIEGKTLDTLPFELVVHILRHVPILTALRALCKSWFTLLGDGDDSLLPCMMPSCVLNMLAHAQRVVCAQNRPAHSLRLHVLFQVVRQARDGARLYCLQDSVFYWGTIKSGAPVGSGFLAVVDQDGAAALNSLYSVVRPRRALSARSLAYGNGSTVSPGDWALGSWKRGKLAQGWASVAESASSGPVYCTAGVFHGKEPTNISGPLSDVYCAGSPRPASYVGSVTQSKCHGWGLWTVVPDADAARAQNVAGHDVHFCGHWRDGVPIRGTFTMYAGHVYEGAFHAGRFHGHGTLVCPDGSIYRGKWLAGSPSGQGTLCQPSRAVGSVRRRPVPLAPGEPPFEGQYSGAWRDGKRHGSGTQTFPDGSTYDGQWHMDRYHGEGTETHVNGTRYVGSWEDGRLHGPIDICRGNGRSHHRGYWVKGKNRSRLSYWRYNRTNGNHGTMVSLLALPLDALGSVWHHIDSEFTLITF